jgi:hypothetical protein
LPRAPEDPVVRSARREAIWAFAVWLAAAVYTLSYCYLYGYGSRPLDEVQFVLWFPDWVFWGIVVPWFACTVVTIYFAYFVMGDEPLDAAQPDAESGEVQHG